jgi:phospholipid/cholesterol/gamma-HCH transport system substrate-binding protein
MKSRLGTQVKRYWIHFAAVLAVMAIGLVVGAVIVVQQRFVWPWEDHYEIAAEFRSAQAVAPGQGQAVMIAGVIVGDVKSVELEDGVAVVTIRIEERYAPIYRDAQLSLRPRTAAQDINIALDPGTSAAGEVPDGGRLSSAHTTPNVNTDEIFAALDADVRDYLRLLISDLGRGVDGNSAALRRLLRAAYPTVSQAQRVSGVLAARRREVARLVHNLNRLSAAVAARDEDVSTAIDASSATLTALARQDGALRESLDLLPGTLVAARSSLRHGGELARALRPAAVALRPVAQALEPGLRAARPLLAEATPALRHQLRPLVQEAIPVVRDLAPAARDLRATLPSLLPVVGRTNRIVNQLLYEPPGEERGYLYYLAWFVHNVNSMLSSEDANGAFIRGLAVFNCSDLDFIQDFVDTVPGLELDLPEIASLPVCGGAS